MYFFRLREIFRPLTFEKVPISFIPEVTDVPGHYITVYPRKHRPLSEEHDRKVHVLYRTTSDQTSENPGALPGITYPDPSDNLPGNIQGIYMYDHAPT